MSECVCECVSECVRICGVCVLEVDALVLFCVLCFFRGMSGTGLDGCVSECVSECVSGGVCGQVHSDGGGHGADGGRRPPGSQQCIGVTHGALQRVSE